MGEDGRAVAFDMLVVQTTPLSAISRWNCSLVYWLPRSE
jgi:hypothetical protein